jgi:hypothetical protein
MKRIATHPLTAVIPATVLLAALAVAPDGAAADTKTAAAIAVPSLSPTSVTVNSTEAWQPLHAFIGSWSGVQSATAPDAKPAKLARKFATGVNSKHLEVTDRAQDKDWQLAGVISFDAESGRLVLRRFAADGKVNDLALDSDASGATKLVFAGVEDNPGRTRVIYDRSGWNEFVERVEYAPQGQAFSLVSETKFKRKG